MTNSYHRLCSEPSSSECILETEVSSSLALFFALFNTFYTSKRASSGTPQWYSFEFLTSEFLRIRLDAHIHEMNQRAHCVHVASSHTRCSSAYVVYQQCTLERRGSVQGAVGKRTRVPRRPLLRRTSVQSVFCRLLTSIHLELMTKTA